jgi:Xaa-Pro dipeptidase
MLELARQRTFELRNRMSERGIAAALLTDQSSIAYYAGFWGYLGVEFGRPTFLLVHCEDDPVVITPLMESEMVDAMTWIADIRTYEDAGNNTWPGVLRAALHDISGASLGIEASRIPVTARGFLDRFDMELLDIEPSVASMRMIKSTEEVAIMRQAGSIAAAMMQAARESLKAGTPEYESALAIIDAGTRKAAGFLTDRGWEAFVSPMVHNLQIMQSGQHTSMVHRRAGLRRYQSGDPVYFCFCNMIDFKQYKLGFDRMFFVDHVSDRAARIQQAAIDAQQAAIAAIRPGVLAEDVAFAADAVYAERGYTTGYRTGRSIGMAWLETPELKAGDVTVLEPGMTFAVDGGISVDGETGGRIGDSVVVTTDGCEYLTDYSRDILVV